MCLLHCLVNPFGPIALPGAAGMQRSSASMASYAQGCLRIPAWLSQSSHRKALAAMSCHDVLAVHARRCAHSSGAACIAKASAVDHAWPAQQSRQQPATVCGRVMSSQANHYRVKLDDSAAHGVVRRLFAHSWRCVFGCTICCHQTSVRP